MDLTAKLQIKPGQTVAAVGTPDDVPPLGDAANPAAEPGTADAVVAFVRNKAELDTGADAAIAAARLDRLAWIAYPKAGKLGTDLNRDILAAIVSGRGVQPVRQVAIDETWSALRFRPALPGDAGQDRGDDPGDGGRVRRGTVSVGEQQVRGADQRGGQGADVRVGRDAAEAPLGAEVSRDERRGL
jgi:hypothetical protein